MKHSIWKSSFITFITVAVLLAAWHFGAVIMDASIILPAPKEVLKTFLALFGEPSFYRDVAATVLRALRSFFIIVISALALGLLSGNNRIVGPMLSPFLAVIKATPVMAIILIAFIWFRSGTVPVFAAFLMGFPVLYQNLVIGMEKRDRHLLEMGSIYGLNHAQMLRYITIPSLLPYILGGAKGALGMTWKVVIAGEILTVPKQGIGSSMQFAQLNLETSEVMAWTVVAIILTAASDGLFTGLVWFFSQRKLSRGSAAL
jgi:NitT/TauT family transport system permease protein